MTRVRDALFLRLAERFRVQVRAALLARLLFLDTDAICLSLGVLPDARHLP